MPKILTSQGPYDITLPATPPGGDGEYPMVCPVCTPTRKPEHKNEKKLSVQMLNLKNGKMQWRCNHCGEGGYVHEDNEKVFDKEIRPVDNNYLSTKPNDQFFDWLLKERGIPRDIAQIPGLAITVSREKILQLNHPDPNIRNKWLNTNAINFKYLYNGELVNIKYRDKRKNFKLISKATKIFFNIDSIKNHKFAVITEGEFDVYAYITAGITPVISVPNGINLSVKEKQEFLETGDPSVFGNVNMEYLDLCIEDFAHLETIYLATDDDIPGIKLREELARRLGKERCRYIRFGDWEVNDPNELLLKLGKETLASTLKYSHEFPIQDVTVASDYWDEIEAHYKGGVSKGISTGYRSLDPHFRWVNGWVVALNGYPGEGKTTAAMNLLTISAYLYGFKWGIYSPENYPVSNMVETIAEILLNNTMSKELGGNVLSLAEIRTVTRQFIDKHFFFVDNEDGFTPKELRAIKKDLILRKGINGFFTDPWSALTHPMSQGSREDIYIRNELNWETRLANRYKIINLISHHPPTPDRKKILEAPSPFNMIGGQIWFNKVFSILCVHKMNRQDISDTKAEIHVQKNKEHKISGIPTYPGPPVIMDFYRRSNRLLESSDLKDPNASYKRFPFKYWEPKDNSLFEGF